LLVTAPQTIISVPVQTAVWPLLLEGAPEDEMAVQLSMTGSYLDPLLKERVELPPPHTIISEPVQTAACPPLAERAPVVVVACQALVIGLNLAPVLR
jgi:hypothetical protein